MRTVVRNILPRGIASPGRTRSPVRACRLPRGDTCCVACAAQFSRGLASKKGSCHKHNADVHILVGAPLEEDLLTGATFLGCSCKLPQLIARHRSRQDRHMGVGDASQNFRVPPDHAPGVPSKMTVPGTSCRSRAARSASATPTPAIAIRLCPQPCPIPGSASISAFTPTTRPRVPCVNSARQAVARPR